MQVLDSGVFERQVLPVTGAMTIPRALELRQTLLGEGPAAIGALDLSETEAIDVTGVQLLLLFQRIRPDAFPLPAGRCSTQVAATLRLIGLDELVGL